MQSLLVFLAVAALSVLASSPALLRAGGFLQLAQLSASGLLFLVLGAALGPHAAAMLSAEDLERLRPLLSLGLGLGGLLIGLNLDLKVLRGLPGAVYAASFTQAALPFMLVAAPLSAVLYLTTKLSVLGSIGAASLLGAAASVSSGHLAVLWHRSGRIDRQKSLSVSLLSMLDDLAGLWVLAIALSFGAASDPGRGVGLIALAMLLGLSCGALLAFLLHRIKEAPELMAVLIGGLALVSGAAAYLRVSVLIAGAFCGATLSLVGGQSVEIVYRVLARFERPLYLVLVFLIGAHLDVGVLGVWLLVPTFVALRFLGKILGGRLATRLGGGVLPLPPRLGYALLAQGGVSLCVLTEYLILVPRPSSQLVFAVGVTAVLVNEVLASRLFRLSLEPEPSKGEPAAEAPPTVAGSAS